MTRLLAVAALAFAAFTGIVSVAAESPQITAIVGKNMKSTVECWTLEQDVADFRGVSNARHVPLIVRADRRTVKDTAAWRPSRGVVHRDSCGNGLRLRVRTY